MRLLVCVSHHGFGHLAQTAAVLNALQAKRPDVEYVVRTALARSVLERRLHFPFRHVSEPVDCGMVMRDALRVDLAASLEAYRGFHRGWDTRVIQEGEWLTGMGVDRVFSNVAYLPLAAARRIGLPAMALCSINWSDIFRHYLGDAAGSGVITDQILEAYREAGRFLRPEPSMPMADLGNTVSISTVVDWGRDRRGELRQRLGLETDTRLVLLGMGGVDYSNGLEHWPSRADLAWLVPDEWAGMRRDLYPFSDTRMSFLDLLASSDALLTKPGYGSFVEAAVHRVPVLYLDRPDWPESPWLVSWLERHGRCSQISEAELQTERVPKVLDHLWDTVPPPPPRADGAETAALMLAEFLA